MGSKGVDGDGDVDLDVDVEEEELERVSDKCGMMKLGSE